MFIRENLWPVIRVYPRKSAAKISSGLHGRSSGSTIEHVDKQKVFGGAERLRVPAGGMRIWGLRNADDSLYFRNLKSAIRFGRPLEPDTVSTVEGRNS